MEAYLSEREAILEKERTASLGGTIVLNETEKALNSLLLRRKHAELDEGYADSSKFLAAQHFLQSQPRIAQSPVYALLRRLPKGASLHTHLLAACSLDYLLTNVTYRDHLYGALLPNGVYKLRFLAAPAAGWAELRQLRAERGAAAFDAWLTRRLSLVTANHQTIEGVWGTFKGIFTTIYDMLSYRPVFEAYIWQVLAELYADNVMYVELRGSIMALYELDGTQHAQRDFFRIFGGCVRRFGRAHPRFGGARYIHSIYRGAEEAALGAGLAELVELRREFPDFVAGFDFVGFEEEGGTLLEHRDALAEAQKELKFYFHAGETNWQGHTDLNLLDAVLLNSSRIGHGYALQKHPELLRLARKKDIPLEICPISNQVLMLIKDQRNHPAANLIATNYPIVVCNDDPLIWNATGLSYDWYVTFMAMTARNAGLEFLKQLAINSIRYSAMNENEKIRAFNQWEIDWRQAINEFTA